MCALYVCCGAGDLEFMHGHGQVHEDTDGMVVACCLTIPFVGTVFGSQVSEDAYNQVMDNCPIADQKQGNLTAQCHSLINSAFSAIGGYYSYALYEYVYERC
jgi:hypothetical protein